MPIYDYRATSADGRHHTGSLYGRDPESVARELGTKGFAVTALWESGSPPTATPDPSVNPTSTESPRSTEVPVSEPVPPAVGWEGPPGAPPVAPRSWVATSLLGPVVGRVGLPHLSFFFRQLAVMLGAGVNPVQSLETLAVQSSSPKLTAIIRELSGHALAGRPLSAGLQRYPEVFSPLMVSLVRAGETGGFLDDALRQTADYIEREIALRNLMRRTTFYPKLVVGASILIFVAANAIIRSLAPQSPVSLSSPLTQAATWVILAPVLVGLFLFLRVGLANPRIKYNWDLFVSVLPWIGKTSRQFAMAKFGRGLGALYQAGVPIPEAIRLASDACGNEYLRARLRPATIRLEGGEGIADTLQATGVLSPIVMNMLATGEKTGNVDQMMTKMAEFYEGEAEVRSVQMGWALGVAALLTVAVYIGYLFITNMQRVIGGPVQEILK